MTHQYIIISGTNRQNSHSSKVATHYRRLPFEKGINATYFSLEGWKWLEKSPAFDQLQKKLMVPAQRMIFILPEYNGSIPGVLKLIIDLSDHRSIWQGKKALLTGISAGRAGNLRGMEQLPGILNYLKVIVHPNKLPISSVDKLLNGEGEIIDKDTIEAINTQLKEFIEF